jgi:hypothetical protein
MTSGEVYCYADAEKPPVGQGLNTDAEITLLNVYKVREDRCRVCAYQDMTQS